MAISYIAQAAGRLLCIGLSSDTKPASPTDDWVFIELDTGKVFRAESAAWVEKLNSSYPASTHSHVAGDVTGTAVLTADSRLSDARTPTAHASTHTTGADKIATGTPDGTKYLRDDYAWANPPGGSNAFPIGSVFIAVVSTNPANKLG